jgi:hypothetical protein
MLTIFLEGILTVAAWRKGWRARALWPMGIVIGMALLISAAVSMSDGSVERAALIGALLDVVCVGVLARLAIKKPL